MHASSTNRARLNVTKTLTSQRCDPVHFSPTSASASVIYTSNSSVRCRLRCRNAGLVSSRPQYIYIDSDMSIKSLHLINCRPICVRQCFSLDPGLCSCSKHWSCLTRLPTTPHCWVSTRQHERLQCMRVPQWIEPYLADTVLVYIYTAACLSGTAPQFSIHRVRYAACLR